MTKKERAKLAVEALKAEYPGAVCSLEYQDPLQLLIAVRLSAQCTDARVNLVTPGLFARFPTLEAFCEGTVEEIGELIRSCGFYNTKSKDILGMCLMIRDEFGGQVPDTIEELTRLPGVGRKTANLIVGDIYHKPAVVTDTRGGELFKSFFTALESLKRDKKPYKILFLDSSDSVLVNRFQETRRKHPLSDEMGGALEQAVKLEREMLKPVKECSDYVIDTSGVSPAQLKARITELFLSSAQDSLSVHCISFGFKFGIPMEADLVFDVRCLPNPFYDEALRPLTGLDAPVRDYVMEKEETQGFVSRFTDLIDYLLPLYSKEGKSQLVIAVGCTGGHHRSVALAQYMCDHLTEKGVKASVTHRDMQKF